MSRHGSTLNKHRKDNYSLDIKGIYKTNIIHTPFSKKIQGQDKYFTRFKTQITHNTSMQSSDKQLGLKPKRRFSLTKTFKMNNSVGIENHLAKQKVKRVTQLFSQAKYEECLVILRQLLTREENPYMKLRLYWLNAKCLAKIGKNKEAEHFYTRLISEEHNNYQALIERAKVRYILGAKELSIKDLNHAIYIEPNKQYAYKELCNLYIEEGDERQAYIIANSAIQKGIQSVDILLYIVELLFSSPDLSITSEQKVSLLIQKLREQIGNESKDSADLLYLQALLLQSKKKWSQACIYYEECLKFNNSKFSVTKSLQRLILIKIEQRDYYSAYHTVNRYQILNIQMKYIYPYVLFLEGVILIMKKKYTEGIKLFDTLIQIIENSQSPRKSQLVLQSHIKQWTQINLNKQQILANFKIHQKCKSVISPLLYKFNAFASFKLGKHEKCISYYEKLSSWGMDECSSYNLLLAQGIVSVEKKKNFQLGMQKFEQARYIYPSKVEPAIYIAITVIYRDLCLAQMIQNDKNESESLTSAVIHAVEELNEAFETINDSSSNLLFHRCILNMYLENWEAAQNDINLCIDRAEENEPKYFYLRGLSFAVEKDLKRAINQYSISLSLDPLYYQSLLQRAKCYFLLGDTEVGFSDLKQYMSQNPTDHKVHKWIGDLLYEGRSYSDALRAYQQIEDSLYFDVQVMKCKCLLRVADLQKVSDCLTKMSKFEQCNESKIQVDILATNLLKCLIKPHQNTKQTSAKIKKLNSFLEENKIGYIFQLIDCMNLLGIATFDSGRYEQAYQSFLLALELYNTLSEKHKSELKSDCSEESLSLSSQDIYLNIIYSLLGMKDHKTAARIMSQQLLISTKDENALKNIANILENYEFGDNNMEKYSLEGQCQKNEKIRFKQVDLKMKNFKIKCFPTFSLFHTCAEDLYSKSVAQKLIRNLKPSYIDNMPQGPWIKRNEHGVIFTDQMIQQQSSSTFLSSMRAKQSQQISQQNTSRAQDQNILDHQKREEFKLKMQLGKQIEKKLNNIINKAH